MKTETTYRIPNLKEFRDGFEYQVYSEGLFDDGIEDVEGWYTYHYNQGACWRDLEDIKKEIEKGNIRCPVDLA